MRTSISDAKNRLSALIDRVRAGETIVILDRGIPVARLAPVSGTQADQTGRTDRLERAGLLRRALQPLPADFAVNAGPPLREGASVVEALLEERREDR